MITRLTANMTMSSLSEKIMVMEITQLKHYRKEFAKVSKVINQNYCKPGRSYNVNLELRRESASCSPSATFETVNWL